MDRPVHVERVSDRHLRIVVGDSIGIDVSRSVHALNAALAAMDLPGRVAQWPGYAELVIEFLPGVDLTPIQEEVLRRSSTLDLASAEASRAQSTVAIPIDFSADAAPDLAICAQHSGLDVHTWQERFLGSDFTVAIIGFQPGFPYLIGLDPQLAMPRRSTPRPRVPAGSVAIGGAQAGIYPAPSPGGWHLIGRTASALFAPDRAPACLLAPGQTVRFVADITR